MCFGNSQVQKRVTKKWRNRTETELESKLTTWNKGNCYCNVDVIGQMLIQLRSEREARLWQRRAAETSEEREAKLQDRLAAESPEQSALCHLCLYMYTMDY